MEQNGTEISKDNKAIICRKEGDRKIMDEIVGVSRKYPIKPVITWKRYLF